MLYITEDDIMQIFLLNRCIVIYSRYYDKIWMFKYHDNISLYRIIVN